MPNCKDFLVTEDEGSISGDARNFSNMETRAVINYFSLQGKAQKEIHAILTESLGKHAPSYVTVKNWVAQFKRCDCSTCVAPPPGRPKTENIPESIDQIYSRSKLGRPPDFG